MPTSGDDDADDGVTPPPYLTPAFIDELDRLNDEELRAVISYEQALLNHRTAPARRIEAAAGEEIVAVAEREGYTEVIKLQPCPGGCSDCPHGPYLYHVRTERSLQGSTDTLHWSFLGHVTGDPPTGAK